MKTFEVEIKGVRPYLMHRYPMDGTETKSKRRVGVIDYSVEAESALYRDEKGTIYVPARQVEGAIEKAAADFQITGKGKKTYKELARAALVVRPDAIPMEPQSYVVDRQPVVVKRQRVIRYRPRWDEWILRFEIDVLDEQFPEEVVNEILTRGGRTKGIGDFRPRFGQFIVTLFREKGGDSGSVG